MILPGTYANGFAPRDGEPLFPELWDGCVGAWNPGLGPTGLTLRDWSTYKNHGTLTNMDAGTDWVTSQGRYALDFDGSDDHIVGSGMNGFAFERITLSAWINRNAIGVNNGYAVSKRRIDDAFQLAVPAANILAFDIWIGNVRYIVNSSNSINTANSWYHISGVYDGSQMLTYVNGRLDCPTPTAVSGSIDATVDPIHIGRTFNSTFSMSGRIDDVRIYDRALSGGQIRLLSLRRGLAYEMVPRRWSAAQVAAYRARYYSQVIGSGVI